MEYGLVLAWKHRFTSHLQISVVPPEHSKDQFTGQIQTSILEI